MARKYQHTQELLPKIKEMLEGGMTQREVAERLGVTGERAIHHLLTRERKKELHGIPKQRGRKPVAVTTDMSAGWMPWPKICPLLKKYESVRQRAGTHMDTAECVSGLNAKASTTTLKPFSE